MQRSQWMVALVVLGALVPGVAEAQPTDPPQPPTEPADSPTDPATPPTNPTDPANPPANPAEPANPPANPAEPANPTDPGAIIPKGTDPTAAHPVTWPVVTPEPSPAPGPVNREATPSPPPPVADEPAPSGFLDAYAHWYDTWLEKILSKPLWGTTAQLPEGVFKLRYNYSHARADKFYGRDGEELPLLPVIVLDDCAGSTDPNCEVTAIDPKVDGSGNTHEFQLAYGITDALDVWVEIPFQDISSTMDLQLLRNGQPASTLGYSIFEQEIKSNGRPLPNQEFDSGMDLGDIRIGTSWNFYRTDYFSTVIAPSVYLPTGTPADPNNDLTFLRGTEIDNGVGAWAAALTSTFDVRPIEWFVLNFEVTPSYRFGYDRNSPRWLPITNCKRLQGADRPADCASDYDPIYDLQQSATFPDLEGLDDTYYVYPGLSLYFMAGFTIEVYHVPFQFGWAFNRSEATTIKATGEGNSGPNFEQLVRSLALLEATELQTLSVGVQIPLLPLYIPIIVTPSYRHVVAGRNTMRLADQYSVAFELFLPVGDAF